MKSVAIGRFTTTLAVLVTISAVELSETQERSQVAQSAAPPCNNYYNNTTPPENIGVGITDPNNRLYITDVVYPSFKSYERDVLPNEWSEAGWDTAAYQAGALAVKTFAWYWVHNWDPTKVSPVTGECYQVTNWTDYQVYCAGSGTPGSGVSCPGTFVRDAGHVLKTNYAIEQTWNWLLQTSGLIYPTHYNSGFSDDYCGEAHPDPNLGLYLGSTMSQWGSQACAANYVTTWAQIVNAYYFNNPQNPPLYQGDHIYGQWHAAMGWGQIFTPVSVSGWTWKFRNSNSCGSPTTTPFDYGAASDIKVVGDWDGNGTHTPGVVKLQNGLLHWDLINTRGPGSPSYSFDYGGYGDIPVVGDWDANGTWTVGVYRGNTWLLNNYNAPGPPNITASWGSGNDTPVPGKWLPTSGQQPMTLGLVSLDASAGVLRWSLRYANAPGGVDKQFNWGPWWGRPITGDWRGSDGLTQFGPGHVTDASPDPCISPNPNQHWTLKYTPDAGGVDNQFGYEMVRP